MRIVMIVSRDVDWALELGAAWSRAGDEVTVVLSDEGVPRARAAHPDTRGLDAAASEGVVLFALHDALTARGITNDALAPSVKPLTIDELADLLSDVADRAVWL